MRVYAAKRGAPPAGAEAIPGLEVRARRMVDEAPRRQDETKDVRNALDLLAAVGHEAPQLQAGVAPAVDVAPRHAAEAAPEPLRALRERMGEKPEAARLVHALDDLTALEAPVVDRLVEAEGEVVVLPVRRDLLA